MSVLSTTAFAHSLKIMYPSGKMPKFTYRKNPCWSMIDKKGDFKGKRFECPLEYTEGSGRSATFEDALEGKSPAEGELFLLTRKKDYAVASWDTETVLSSEGNEAAFAPAIKTEMDAKLRSLRKTLGIDIYRDGSGTRGVIGSVTDADPSVITLSNPAEVTNFAKGLILVSTPNPSSTTPTVRTHALVAKINRSAGTLTMDQNCVDLDWTAADSLVVKGDIKAAGGGRKFSGISAWIPTSLEAGTFYGVDRSQDRVVFAGSAVDASTLRIDQAIKRAARIAAERGDGDPDTVFMNYTHFEEFENTIEGTVERVQGVVAEVGFPGIRVNGPHGKLNVFPDRNCPHGKAYVLELGTWQFKSLGKAPRVISLDGRPYVVEPTADAWQVRMAYWGNLWCRKPSANAVVHSL